MSATKGIRWRMAAVAALMAALLTLAWAASAEAQESGWDCRQHEQSTRNYKKTTRQRRADCRNSARACGGQ